MSRPSLLPEANPMVIASLSGLLAADFRGARNRADLHHRLGLKGFTIKSGNLVTLPHGKLICALSEVGG
ncbi:MAG: hypothetical protein AAGF78_11100 [Pseudomonadota bacterium]